MKNLGIFLLCVFVSTDMFAQCAGCNSTISSDQTNLTVPIGQTYCIAAGVTVDGTVTIGISGTLCNEGTLSNITLTMNSSSVLNNYGSASISNNFTISTTQTINTYAGSTLDFAGTLGISRNQTVNGTLTVGSTLSCNSGYTLTNNAGATITCGGAFTNSCVTTNSGVIISNSGNCTFGRNFTNNNKVVISGNLTCNSGYTLTNSAAGDSILIAGAVTSACVINNSGYIKSDAGDFNQNSGYSLTNSGDLLIMGGAFATTTGAAVTNSGQLQVSGNISLSGNVTNSGAFFNTGAGSTLTLSSGYTITNNSSGKVSIEGNAALTGNFTNNGDSVTLGGNVTLNSGYDLTNASGKYFYLCGTMTATGDITNSGEMHVLGTLDMTGGGYVLTNNSLGSLTVSQDVELNTNTFWNYGVTSIQNLLWLQNTSSTFHVRGGDVFCKDLTVANGDITGGAGACGRVTITGTSSISGISASVSGNVDIYDTSPGAANGYQFDSGESSCSGTHNSCSGGDSEGTYSVVCTLLSLPIELLSFTAHPSGNHVIVRWVTAAEINNNYFTVERSADGIRFEPAGVISGHGNSAVTLSYSFTDDSPHRGTSYYRLRQTDFDGRSEAFAPVPVTLETEGSEVRVLTLYPNPSAGPLALSLFVPEATIIRVEVLDATGRVFYASEEVTDKGTSSLALDVSFLSPGLYFVKISHEGGTDSRRFVRN